MRANKAEEVYQESRFNWLLFLLALIINLIILFFLFLVTIDNNFWNTTHEPFNQPEAPVVFQDMPQVPEAPKPLPPPEMPKPDEVAALKPGASQFGMPDELKEDEFIAKLPELESAAEALEEEKEREQIVPEQIMEEPVPQEIIQQPEPLPKQQENNEITVKTEQTPPEIKKEEKKPPVMQQARIEQKPEKKEVPQQPLTPPQKIKAPIKKELSFNDLAQGFLASLDEGGNDLMERKGNENIRPDFQEMRYLSYLHKIIWYMQNEWRRDTSLIECGAPTMVITGVSITIDKDGNLKNASVVQSCGIHQLDEAILRGIRAGSPYPPLPSHLKKDILTVEFGVKHIGRQSNRVNFHFR